MNNIVCLKWGEKYDADYVNKLYAGVKRNTTVAFTFHCFTDDPININSAVVIHPLPVNNIEGWWNKLFLFSNDIDIDGRVLFIDLDTLITGNIDEIIKIDKGFIMLKDFFHPMQNNDGSGLMSFDTKQNTNIWHEFIKNPAENSKALHPHGDQKWIVKFVKNITHWQDIVPKQVVSFKIHCGGGLPDNTTVVCYHGKPSIPESINTTTKANGLTITPAEWVKDYWNAD